MNEILFRGKGKGSGKWHEGFYAKCNSKEGAVHCIIEDDYSPSLTGKAWGNPIYEIDPDTLGQFTGMTVNGVKIFEGDIVSFARVNALGYTKHRIGYVRYYEKLPLFYIAATTGDAWDWCECAVKKVIGNVHDNPELLKEAEV